MRYNNVGVVDSTQLVIFTGKDVANKHVSSLLTNMSQKLSLLSILQKLKWCSLFLSMCPTIRLIIFQSWTIALVGASLLAASFTNMWNVLLWCRRNDTSRIMRYALILCGMHTTGIFFMLGGKACLMYFHLNTSAKPFLILWSVSACNYTSASCLQADLWALCSVTSMMRPLDQSSQLDTGQLLVAYVDMRDFAGWYNEYNRGHIRLCLHVDSFTPFSFWIHCSLRTESFRFFYLKRSSYHIKLPVNPVESWVVCLDCQRRVLIPLFMW